MNFSKNLKKDEDWELKGRMDGRVMKKIPAREYGTRLLMQHGVVQIRVPNTILPLMNGIPAPKVAAIVLPTPALNTCSLTTRPVIWHRST